MRSVVVSLLLTLRVSLRDRAALQLEILALRHQLHVVNRSRPQRLRLTQADRMLWVWLSKRLGRMAGSHRDRQARDGPRLAPSRLPALLDVEEPTPPGSTGRSSGRPPVDSHDGGGQPVVGRATHSRRTPEAGHRRESGDRCEVHAPAPTAALPDVAHVSHESCRPDHGRRFLRRADRHVSTPLRAGHPGASSDAASCTWRSRPIPRRRGPPNNSARRFPGTRSLAISFAIVITPSRGSDPRRPGWGSTRCSPRHGPRGRTRTRSVSSAPFDASVSIT